MATVKNTALHAVSLPSGRVLAPGRSASGVTLSDVSDELLAGLLTEVKPLSKKPKSNAGNTPEQKES